MANFGNLTDFRLLLPEVIWLQPEHFEQARQTKSQVNTEAQQWQTYLNALALHSFAQWLQDRIPEFTQEHNVIASHSQLQLGELKFGVIATEHLLDEVVNVPLAEIDSPEAANFYVLIEVLEEQEEVLIRGFMRDDQLINYCRPLNFHLESGCYQLPVSAFDAEPNHLLYYCRFLEPSAIALRVSSDATTAEQNLLRHYLNNSTIKLSQWLEGVFDSGWHAIDSLLNPEANLALRTKSVDNGVKRCKLIDLGMQLGSQTVALLVHITAAEEKLGVLIQLHPTGGNRYLPPEINLTLRSQSGKTLQQVQARTHDNYIQLKPFKGEAGKCFSIEVNLLEISARENFEL